MERLRKEIRKLKRSLAMNSYEKIAQGLTEEQKTAYDQLWEEGLDVWQEKARREGSHNLLRQLVLAPRFRNDLSGTLAHAIDKMDDCKIPMILKAITQSLEDSGPFAKRLEGYGTPAQKAHQNPSSSLSRVSPEAFPEAFPE